MIGKWNQKAVVIAVITLVFLGVTWPIKWGMVITDDMNKKVFVLPVSGDMEFSHSSIHSVSKTILVEYFSINEYDGRYVFVTDKVRYEDQSGAGLPEYAYDESVFYEEDGYFYIDDIGRIHERMIFQVEETYQNRLYINKSTYDLYGWTDDGKGSLTFDIMKLSIIELYIR